jgi:hypothetical protein
MNSYFIAPIVEGHGEVESVPILLHRLFDEMRSRLKPGSQLIVNPPIRIKSGSFLGDAVYFKRHVELAALKAKARPNGSVLILLDCEDTCPAILGPKLLNQAQSVRNDTLFAIALAYREYETWFLTAAESLRTIGELPVDLTSPNLPETIRNAKKWLAQNLPQGYQETRHQPLFTRHFSLAQAAASDSFVELRQKFSRLVA